MVEKSSVSMKTTNRYREFLGRSPVATVAVQRAQVFAWLVIVVGCLAVLAATRAGSVSVSATTDRHLDSLTFPQVRPSDDYDDILKRYPQYLNFVLEVGRQTDNASATRLYKIYQTLRKRYPQHAARFLKGLRFEMVQKLEMMGANPGAVSTSSPEMRRWVGKFMKEWVREADEHLFRAVTLRTVKD